MEAYQNKIEEPFISNLVDSLVNEHRMEISTYIYNFVVHHLRSIFPFISFPKNDFPYLSSLISLEHLKNKENGESNFLGLMHKKERCKHCKK